MWRQQHAPLYSRNALWSRMPGRFLAVLTLVSFGWGLVVIDHAQGSPGYSTYVGCDTSARAAPSHQCFVGDRPGAFFESSVGDVQYEVCVQYPTGRELCAPQQGATVSTLYVNSITTTIPGIHVVTWRVAGTEVGQWSFRLIKPVRPPTITRLAAERATRNVLHKFSTWRYRRVGFYDCFGGRLNRTEWVCRAGWVKGRRCFRGRVRVFGVVENNEQYVNSVVRSRRTC